MGQTPIVLVADDDADARTAMCFRLRLDGYCTVHAECGREVVDAVHIGRPDVLLLDLDMSDVDGWDVLKALHHDPDVADVRIVVLTGDASEMTEQRALCAGAEAYIVKPVSEVDVARTVDRVLGLPERDQVVVA